MAATSTRANDFASRWDSQQERYLPHREERFSLMLDFVAGAVEGSKLRLLDLCCGTGSISKRALGRFPAASILAVDNDPAHLELGRRALGDRVEWRDADLHNQRWADDLEDASFDAVLSATAIHWFQPNEVVAMYRTLARLLRRDGVFANADHMPVSSEPIAARSQKLLDAWQAEQLRDGEDYYVYRDALREDPELRPLVEEGDRRFADKPAGVAAPLAFHREALLVAGFATADEPWRHLADAILVAIR
jgi:ubiquinone/menaquinone biosynthesis C-methylase UbiE